MSQSTAGMQRKIASARDLQSVVRTMKALAASSIGQYEKSVSVLGDYYRTIELGLGVCLREGGSASQTVEKRSLNHAPDIGVVIFGSDQGLVGQFNNDVADFAFNHLAAMPGKPQVWAVGQRLQGPIEDAGLTLAGVFPVPNSMNAIAPLVAQILIAHEGFHGMGESQELHLFRNRPAAGPAYEPVHQKLLPLDASWCRQWAATPWPAKNLPEIIGDVSTTLPALIREYLFVSIFRACAESLASENASRLAAMQRADNNIDKLLETLQSRFHQLRQSSMDAELFDVIAGFEALVQANRTVVLPSSLLDKSMGSPTETSRVFT